MRTCLREFAAYKSSYAVLSSTSFSQLDTNAGGAISKIEFLRFCKSGDNFASYDVNGDCTLSCPEFNAYVAASGNMYAHCKLNNDHKHNNSRYPCHEPGVSSAQMLPVSLTTHKIRTKLNLPCTYDRRKRL